MNEFRSIACIALGSNLPLGELSPARALIEAVRAIAEQGIVIRSVSRFFATPCFPAGAGPNFVNAAIIIDCELSPPDLLAQLHSIEKHFHRERNVRWGARTLDIDLLTIGQNVAPDAESQQGWMTLSADSQQKVAPDTLVLPHPRMQERAFVLVPMMDICPDWQHPVLKRTVRELVADLPAEDRAAVVAL